MLGRWQKSRRWATVGVLALALGANISCGSQNKDSGVSPSYLYIASLTAASGARPDFFTGALQSDVLTYVKVKVAGQEVLQPTIFEDMGSVLLRMGLKDGGSPNHPTSPSWANSITVTRYRVDYKRTDGRNTPGVDVPYSFDGAATGTFDANGGSITFVLVRAMAKQEAPLKALRGGGGAYEIATIAEITFYGKDQAGNDVSVTGRMSVNFADWGDPL